MNKFIYVHILKTAGTTLHEIFKKHFKRKFLYDAMWKLKRNKNIKDPKHPLIFEGQKYPPNYKKYDVIFGHFKYDKYLHLKLPMFSFIRHPVDRMISHYYYHKPLYERVNRNMSLIDFSKEWKNHMSYILGDISQYTFIGVSDEFKKSLNKMCDILNIDVPKKVLSKRVQKKGISNISNVSKKIKNQIEIINSIDMELYHKILKTL